MPTHLRRMRVSLPPTRYTRPMLALLLTLLAACGTPACPDGVALTDADLPCTCGTSEVDSLPGHGELVCDGDTLAVETSDSGDDSGDSGE